jgi:hypothetical protein
VYGPFVDIVVIEWTNGVRPLVDTVVIEFVDGVCPLVDIVVIPEVKDGVDPGQSTPSKTIVYTRKCVLICMYVWLYIPGSVVLILRH